jgi:hypothetical protein
MQSAVSYDVAIAAGNDLIPVRMAIESIDKARDYIKKLRTCAPYANQKILIIRETTTTEFLSDDGSPV